MFAGAGHATHDRIHGGNVQAFGNVRGQTVDAEILTGEQVISDSATITSISAGTLALSSALSVPSIIVNDGDDTINIGYDATNTAGVDSIVLGSGTGAADNTISIGQNNTTTAAGDFSVVVGFGSTVNGSSSISLGNGIATRHDNEFATQGMRVIRLTASTTNATPTTAATIFTLNADGEIASVDGAVTALRTDAAPLGSEGVTWKFENYMIRREAGTGLVLLDGTEFENDPDGKSYAVTLSAAGNNLQFSVTGAAAENVSWILVFRIWCAPLV
jgi:hypothetical protein